MEQVNWQLVLEPIIISVKISIVASVTVFLLSLFISRFMSRRTFKGKLVLEAILMLPLILPPTVVGFILLYLFGKQGVLGQLLQSLFNWSVVFTWWGGVIAAIVVAFPLVYQTMKAGFDSIDKDLEAVARSLGANEWQVFVHVAVPLTRKMLLVAFVLGFARALGEFGATLMLAGNIPGRTQTIATAIYVAVEADRLPYAIAWVGMMVIFSFLLMVFVRSQSKH